MSGRTSSFYLPQYIGRKKEFSLTSKDEDNGWPDESPIRLEIRKPDGVTVRSEREWPHARRGSVSI